MAEESERRDHDETVEIHDEDDGTVFRAEAEAGSRVSSVVDRFYKDHLHRDRRFGDRLGCEATGDSVFGHLDETIEHYEKTACLKLVWLFAGDQGGAWA